MDTPLRRRMIAYAALAAVVAVAVAACTYGADLFDRRMNRVAADPEAPEPDAADRAFHESLFIADLHADTLKWERDLLERSAVGHVDVPRLAEGNVALQVFTIVTKSPIPRRAAGLPGGLCVSAGSPNVAAVLAALQGRPAFSLRERALHQVARFKEAADRSRRTDGPELRLIADADDLARLVADRRAGKAVIGGILGIEGGHWVGDPEQGAATVRADMQQLYDAGIRMFAPTHRFDNALAGASEGCERYGLTENGRLALREAERLGMAVDLAHIAPRAMVEAVEMLDQPPLVSHTGIQAGCEPPCRPSRNLSDAEIALILQKDGLIGVGYWPQAIGPSIWRIGDAMAHIMDMTQDLGLPAGRHVALGSDYDGSVTPFFDTSRLEILTTVLRRRPEPFDAETIRAIAGRNVCRLFATTLPGGGPEAAAEICAAAGAPAAPAVAGPSEAASATTGG